MARSLVQKRLQRLDAVGVRQYKKCEKEFVKAQRDECLGTLGKKVGKIDDGDRERILWNGMNNYP
jgi:hypothetical protein